MGIKFMEQQIQSQIPGYTISEVLLEDFLGVLYRARNDATNGDVYLRVLPGWVVAIDECNDRFTVDINLGSILKHVNISSIITGGVHEGCPYYIYDKSEGYTVADWVKRKQRLAEGDSLAVIEMAACGLNYASNVFKISHGGINPDNLHIAADGNIKISEFFSFVPLTLARIDVAFGSRLNFVAPEILGGMAVATPASDMFSFGASLFYMTTGQLPFGSGSDDELKDQVINYEKDPADFNSDISAPTRSLIKRLMAKKPSDRFTKVRDGLDAIRSVMAGKTV